MIDHHVGLAEIVRHPAPALHVGEDDIDRADRGAAIERVDGRRVERAARRDLVLLLELLHRLGERLVVGRAPSPITPSRSRNCGTRRPVRRL